MPEQNDAAGNRSLYLLIGVVVVVTVAGAILSRDNAVQLLGFGATIITLVYGQKKAAARVEEVKETLKKTEAKTDHQLEKIVTIGEDNAKVGIATHTLCNSAMGEQKRLYAAKCRATANKTGDEADIAEAELAERMYEEHQKKQGIVDVQTVKDEQDQP